MKVRTIQDSITVPAESARGPVVLLPPALAPGALVLPVVLPGALVLITVVPGALVLPGAL